MIYLYRDLEKQGLNNYQIKKNVNEKKLFFIDKGLYSDKADYNYLEVICKKHPNAIFTLDTAAFCYGLINKNSKPYKIVTKQKDRKINDEKLKQIFMSDNLYLVGMNNVKYLGFNINIYDLERLLIEVVRNKKNLDFELYSQIILGFKKIARLLKKEKILNYLSYFKDSKIKERINRDLFEI